MKKLPFVLLTLFLFTTAACNLSTQLSGIINTSTPVPTAIPTATQTPAPTPTPAPVTVHLDPSGNGDYATLLQAVESVPPQSTIILAEGTFLVDPYLSVTKPLTIQGAGMDKTNVVASTGQIVADFKDAGNVTLSGITFQFTGTQPADVVSIEGGTVNITNCRFIGGIFFNPEDKPPLGNGLLITGKTDGLINSSIFENNQYLGMIIHGDSTLAVEASLFSKNGGAGLGLGGNYVGNITGNSCIQNAEAGIIVTDDSNPVIVSNTCTGNAGAGIEFFNNSSGTVQTNALKSNGTNGISLTDGAHPLIDGNTLSENTYSGIEYSGNTSGKAQNNICSNNKSTGIYITDNASPLLESNICNENDLNGFTAAGTSKPTLLNNTAQNNGQAGFGFFEGSGGSADGNTCAFNGWGLLVDSTATPLLSNNNCYSNTSADILDKR